MPPFVLTVLKIVFLILLYFFVYRAIRSVVVDLRATAGTPRRAEARSRPAVPSSRRRRGKPPRSVVVLDERGSRGRPVRLNGTLQIGRADACQLRLSDTYASSFHARVYQGDGRWLIEDLGSTNGTYLNQRRITGPEEVTAGDQVRIGKSVLEFRR